MRILVTGGAGFIGSAVTRLLVQERGATVLVVDKLTYAGDRRSHPRLRGAARLPIPRGRHLRPAADARRAWRNSARCGDAPGGREPCRPLDHRRGRLHPDQYPRHLLHAGGGARLPRLARRRGQGGLPLPPHLDRRGLRLARRRPARSARPPPTTRARPIRPARRPPTIWCAPGTRPTGCRCWSPIARTITAPTTSPRS